MSSNENNDLDEKQPMISSDNEIPDNIKNDDSDSTLNAEDDSDSAPNVTDMPPPQDFPGNKIPEKLLKKKNTIQKKQKNDDSVSLPESEINHEKTPESTGPIGSTKELEKRKSWNDKQLKENKVCNCGDTQMREVLNRDVCAICGCKIPARKVSTDDESDSETNEPLNSSSQKASDNSKKSECCEVCDEILDECCCTIL